jgi:hypothetical protein
MTSKTHYLNNALKIRIGQDYLPHVRTRGEIEVRVINMVL